MLVFSAYRINSMMIPHRSTPLQCCDVRRLTPQHASAILTMAAAQRRHQSIFKDTDLTIPSASAVGSYVLIVRVPSPITIETGGLGKVHFDDGFYAYVGSALGGLKTRLRRHVSKKKTPRWHIDYLTNRTSIRSIVIFESSERLECAIANALKPRFASVGGFGCSDCDCCSHLFFASGEDKIHTGVREAVAEIGVPAKCLERKDMLRYVNPVGSRK